VQGEDGLLVRLLDGDQASPRLLHGGPDSLGVGRIGLVAQHEGTDRAMSQQSNPMSLLLKLASPPVGTAALLHRHLAGWPSREKGQDFIASQLDALDLSGFRIKGMQLENLLGDVHANHILFHGGSRVSRQTT
jgi:hypothetical protein